MLLKDRPDLATRKRRPHCRDRLLTGPLRGAKAVAVNWHSANFGRTGQRSLACCYMDGDSTSSRHDEAARRKVSFQVDPASGPGQATSATRRHDRIET